MLKNLVEWLLSTQLSQAIQEVEWIVPTLQTIHILFIAVVLSSVAMIILRVLGLIGRSWTIYETARRFLPWIWTALIALVITGTLLLIGEPKRSLLNPVFQAKMAMLATMIVVAAVFQRSIYKNKDAWDETLKARPAARLIGGVSLLIWVCIIIAGRWIAYVSVP
jgi:uncharacterized membrane protein